MRSNGSDACERVFVHRDHVAAARKAIPKEPVLESLSETFKALGDRTRLRMVLALSDQELCVCDLANLLELSESAVSHQLRLLKTMRLVRHRKEGKMVYYRLDDEHIESLIRVSLRHVKESAW